MLTVMMPPDILRAGERGSFCPLVVALSADEIDEDVRGLFVVVADVGTGGCGLFLLERGEDLSAEAAKAVARSGVDKAVDAEEARPLP